jgi:hypothetical protein
LLNAPGRHASFRVATDAEPAEWDAAVARTLQAQAYQYQYQ